MDRRWVVAALVSMIAPIAMVTIGYADTANPPTTTKATVVGAVPAQVDVAPNGPLTGLVDGTVVRVTISAKPGNEGKFFGAQARLCKPGVNITNLAGFSPTQLGNCIDQPLSMTSNEFLEVSAATANTTVTFDFVVGVGTRSFTSSVGGPTTITCGPDKPCSLWLKESVDTALIASGVAWIHYDLQFAGAGTTTTTVAPTTTTTVAPTSTTVRPTTSTTSPRSFCTILRAARAEFNAQITSAEAALAQVLPAQAVPAVRAQFEAVRAQGNGQLDQALAGSNCGPTA